MIGGLCEAVERWMEDSLCAGFKDGPKAIVVRMQRKDGQLTLENNMRRETKDCIGAYGLGASVCLHEGTSLITLRNLTEPKLTYPPRSSPSPSSSCLTPPSGPRSKTAPKQSTYPSSTGCPSYSPPSACSSSTLSRKLDSQPTPTAIAGMA